MQHGSTRALLLIQLEHLLLARPEGLTPAEIASRLLADHSDRHNPHAAAAVRELGHTVARIAPRIGEVIDANADILDDDDTRRDVHFLGVLERLTRAWT